MVLKVCEQCSGKFNKSPAAIARGEGRFCSNVCRDTYKRLHPEERSGEKAPLWKGGVTKENKLQRSRDYTKSYPARRRAYDHVKYAIRKGRLQKGPCRDCGTTEYVHAHHADYSKPLEVIWLCPTCHLKQHGLLGSQAPLRPRNRERQKRERDAAKKLHPPPPMPP